MTADRQGSFAPFAVAFGNEVTKGPDLTFGMLQPGMEGGLNQSYAALDELLSRIKD